MVTPQHLHPVLALLCLAFASPVHPAHSEGPIPLGAQLRNAFAEALAAIGPQNEEVLRRAQRAWIPFSDKNEAVTKSLRNHNLLTPEAVNTLDLIDTQQRISHLLGLFVRAPRSFGNPQAEWQVQDHQLQNVYAECIRRFGKDDQILLRDAQQAWIAFRDLDVAAADRRRGLAPMVAMQAKANLTANRVAQLKAWLSAAATPVVAPDAPIVATNAPSAEDQKAIGKWKDDAQAWLKTFAERKDAPFFANADTIKHMPELPSDMASEAAAIDTRFTTFARRGDLAKALEPALNEAAIVGVLAAWPQFTRQLKAGSIDEAGAGLGKALDRKPKNVSPDYLPIWSAAEAWRSVFKKAAGEYQTHVQKARSLAALGKNAEAIREYEAAFAIIEIPSIPAEIKKLREQSLGL